MVNLDRFISDILDCIGIPYVSPGYTGTRPDLWKTVMDEHGRFVDVPTIDGIDCSGLLVRAYKIQGQSLYHGSNYIARYELSDKVQEFKKESQLCVGMAVFKWSSTGEPSKYAGDGKGNYHHVGVVTSVNPLTITHASSVAGRVKQDTTIKGWTHYGALKAVKYSHESEDEPMQTYKVIAASGDTVNLRYSASTQSDVLVKVPVGAQVEGARHDEGWASITYQGVKGFMMLKFLQPVQDDSMAEIEKRIRDLEQRVTALEGGKG